ncbi:MAG: putative lipid II flippase FtsW [Treponema sp.]|nr:MAG: putative lipid II flippase FtsW [Treponema sp.]
MISSARISPEKNIKRQSYDFTFIMMTFLLLGLGFTVLYSGSVHYGQRFFDNPLYFVKRQFFHFVIGLVLMVFCAYIKPERLRQLLPAILVLSFVFMVLTFIPIVGHKQNGAARWVRIWKFKFQPSEFVKITLVLFLANFFDKKQSTLNDPFIAIFPPFIVSGIFIGLTYLEPDFSTAMFLALICAIMFFIAGVKISWFLKGLICFLPVASIMILSKAYRLERVISFLFPEHDPLGAGYQVNASVNALTSGGIWGVGLGNGIKKIFSVPEVCSDFIFVVWAEEMGYIGVCVYLLLLSLFAFSGYKIAVKAKDKFLAYLAFGAVSSIVFQSLLNCAVVSRMLPATGIPMPFFSYGGSSLISTMCFCGLIINVSGYSVVKGESNG